jgi:hyperosmotically inducible periplasmic protein
MDTALGVRRSYSYFAHSLSDAWLYINESTNTKGGFSMRPLRNLLVVMLTVFSLAGCQAMTGKTAGRNVDDATLTSSVKTKLAADKLSSLTRVDVDTNNGIVSLNGVVESSEQRARAQELASQVSGVNKVVNNLQVQQK